MPCDGLGLGNYDVNVVTAALQTRWVHNGDLLLEREICGGDDVNVVTAALQTRWVHNGDLLIERKRCDVVRIGEL